MSDEGMLPATEGAESRTSRAARGGNRADTESKKPPSPATLFWQRLVVAVMVGAAKWVQRLSQSSADRLGSRLGDFAYRFAGTARRRGLANLRLALGNSLTEEGRKQLIRQVFRHYGGAIVAFLRAPTLTPEELAGRVSCEGWEHAEAALARGRGLLLVTAHIGNWEVLGWWLARVKSLPLTVVARDPEQPALAAYLRRMRENAGFAVRGKGESPLALLKALKRGEAICLLPDQNSGDVFVPFFGVPAGTVAGPAALALRSGAPLVPIYCLARGNGSYQVTCLPPIEVQASGNHTEDLERIMGQVNLTLENVIRKDPSQWLWLHNRWKSAFEEKNHGRAWTDEAAYREAVERWKG